jgi:hypothetical protein
MIFCPYYNKECSDQCALWLVDKCALVKQTEHLSTIANQTPGGGSMAVHGNEYHSPAFVDATHTHSELHSNALDHSNSLDHAGTLDHDGGAQDTAIAGKAASSHSHEAFPVGSVFIGVVATNPNSLLGYGTWAALATGRMLVGIDTGDADFNTVKKTGGAKTVAASAQAFTGTQSTVVVNHTHPHNMQGGTTGVTTGTNVMGSSATGGSARAMAIASSNPTGGAANYTPAGTNAPGAATSIVQPYLVVYMWERVS